MRLNTRMLKLYATAIALQQMHGKGFAQAFLEEQGVIPLQAKTLTDWVEASLPESIYPVFEVEFLQAVGLLKAMCAYTVALTQEEAELVLANVKRVQR